jgi:hypothetical protein
MAPTNMAATTTDPYGYNGYNCFLTLWTTLAQLNNAQNLNPRYSNIIKHTLPNILIKKMLRISCVEIYPYCNNYGYPSSHLENLSMSLNTQKITKPGEDGIQLELFKYAGEDFQYRFLYFINSIWQGGHSTRKLAKGLNTAAI